MSKKNIVLLFPGVGSQYSGMCKDLYNRLTIVKNTFEEASDVLQTDVAKLCFDAEYSDTLNKLENSQLALLTVSVSLYRLFKQEIGVDPESFIGHSLGEYSALCCDGIITFPDALKLVKQRGSIISEVCKSVSGTMAWVVNIDKKVVEGICKKNIELGNEIYLSSYNSPMKTSISGKIEHIRKAAKDFESKGAIVIPLNLQGPFHSPLMKDAARLMKKELLNYQFINQKVNVISNVTGMMFKNIEDIINNLANQLILPIQWENSVNYLIDNGVTYAIEMGAKDVLKFLVKDNTNKILTDTFNSIEDVEKVKDTLLVAEDEYLNILGKCLGVIVSTKNKNDDNNAYARAVDKYTEIENMLTNCADGSKTPTLNDMVLVLKNIKECLKLKMVKESTIDLKIQRILNNKYLN